MSILFTVLTILLVVVSVFMILIILMQRGNANSGMGAAMGGGMAESVLGAESSNVLSKTTRKTAIVFFVMVFGLYLAWLWIHENSAREEGRALPTFEASPAEPGNQALEDLLSMPTDIGGDNTGGQDEAADGE